MTTIELNDTTNLEDYRKAGGNPDSGENQHICGRLVDREVLHCISATVTALGELCADGQSEYVDYDELMDLSRGYEYEEPGKDHVAEMDKDDLIEYCSQHDIYADCDSDTPFTENDDVSFIRQVVIDGVDDWEQFCRDENVDPHDIDVYEHWAVTGWFKKRLAEHGEVTGDLLDFDVWGRSCTGQAIKMDHVIQSIAAEMQILDGQAIHGPKISSGLTPNPMAILP